MKLALLLYQCERDDGHTINNIIYSSQKTKNKTKYFHFFFYSLLEIFFCTIFSRYVLVGKFFNTYIYRAGEVKRERDYGWEQWRPAGQLLPERGKLHTNYYLPDVFAKHNFLYDNKLFITPRKYDFTMHLSMFYYYYFWQLTILKSY